MSDYSDLRRLIADVNKNFPEKEDEWSTFCTPLIVSLILDDIDHMQAALNRPDENIAGPVDSYDGLRVQFNALRTLYHSKSRQLEYWRKQSDEAYRADALKHRTEADCERDTNAMLTNALEVAEAERDRLANEVQRITEARRIEFNNAEQVKAELESHKRMLLAACAGLGAVGEALGSDSEDDASEIEGLAIELRTDAGRYRWLRAQHWNTASLAVVTEPKKSVKLGFDCPSTDRLDEMVDAAMAEVQP